MTENGHKCPACEAELEVAWETARYYRKAYQVMKNVVVYGVTDREKVELLDEALMEAKRG